MMYNWPRLREFDPSITTNVAPNTDTTTTILAAPGANLRYRIFNIDVGGRTDNTGRIICVPTDGAGDDFAVLGIPLPGSGDHWFSDVGWPLGINQTFQITHRSNVASQVFWLATIYAIEASV